MKPSMHPLFKYALLVAVACPGFSLCQAALECGPHPALAAKRAGGGREPLGHRPNVPPEAAKTNAPAAASPAASANTSPVTAAKGGGGPQSTLGRQRGRGHQYRPPRPQGTPGNPPGDARAGLDPPRGQTRLRRRETNAAKGETGKGPDGDGVPR